MKDSQTTVTYTIHHRDGYRYEIGEDADGLGCVEITFIHEDIRHRITFGREEVSAVAEALRNTADFLEARDA